MLESDTVEASTRRIIKHALAIAAATVERGYLDTDGIVDEAADQVLAEYIQRYTGNPSFVRSPIADEDTAADEYVKRLHIVIGQNDDELLRYARHCYSLELHKQLTATQIKAMFG